MTRDEIRALKPGRELDALIATKIFGWYFKKMPTGKMLLPPDNDERKYFAAVWDENGIPGYLPEYSTDISAAWELIEYLVNKGLMYEIRTHRIEETIYYSITFSNYLNNKIVKYHCCYENVLEAICKAALKATMNIE